MSIPRRHLRRLLTALLVAAAFAYLIHTAAEGWRELRRFRWEVDPLLLGTSVAAHVAVLAGGVWIWSRVLRRFAGGEAAYAPLLRVWAMSNAARYIPGAVWQFVTAAQLSREAGLPGVLALTSMLVHVALTLLAAVMVSAAVIPFGAIGLPGLDPSWIRVLLLATAIAAVHPGVINGALRLVPRTLHKSVLTWNGSWGAGLALLALACLSWLLYGVAYALFVASLTPVALGSYPLLTGVNALSFVAGYLAVLAPGGIGVRESAMTLLLAPVLPGGVAAVVAVGARLWSVVAEVLLAGVALAAARASRRSPDAAVDASDASRHS